MSFHRKRHVPPPAQTVEGVFLERSTALLVGPPGSGKGLLVIDLIYHISLGWVWHGHATRKGPCVYIALERQAGLGARVRAWKQHHHVDGSCDVFFIIQSFSLFERTGAEDVLIALATLDRQPAVVVIDTIAKSILPGDENSTHDMGTFAANLERIAQTGPTVIGIHHLNAAGERERGNSSFRGAADTVVFVKPREAGVQLVCEKQNELAPFAPINMEIRAVGESAVIVTAEASSNLAHTAMTRSQLTALESLRSCSAVSPASTSTWLKVSELKERTFYDARNALIAKRYVTQQGTGRGIRYALTTLGDDALTAACGNTAEPLRPQPHSRTAVTAGGFIEAPASAVNDRGEEDEFEQLRAEGVL